MLLPTEEERVCVCKDCKRASGNSSKSERERKGRGARSGHRASVWWPLGQLRHQRRGVKMKSSRKINEASWVNALPPPKGSTDGAGAGADDDEGDEGDEGGELVQERRAMDYSSPFLSGALCT